MLSPFSVLSQSTQIPPAAMAIYSTPGVIDGSVFDLPSTMLMLAVSVAISSLLIWTSWSRIVDTIHVLRRGAAARDLFLKMNVKFGPKKSDAYLRYIDRREADIVCAVRPIKGQTISLVMESLPGFPLPPRQQDHHDLQPGLQIEAKVVKIRTLGGSPERFLVVAKFQRLPENAESPLLTYIHSLISPGRVYS